MATVEFIFNSLKAIIQCEKNENMKNICNKFAIKSQKDLKNLCFLYNCNTLSEDLMKLSFNETNNNTDREGNSKKLLVYEMWTIIENNKNNKSIRSKEIICPECGESITNNINDYKIKLFDCKNNHIKYLSFKELEKSQNIDESKIICDKCK